MARVAGTILQIRMAVLHRVLGFVHDNDRNVACH